MTGPVLTEHDYKQNCRHLYWSTGGGWDRRGKTPKRIYRCVYCGKRKQLSDLPGRSDWTGSVRNILRLLREGRNAQEVHELTGCSDQFVKKIRRQIEKILGTRFYRGKRKR